MYVKVCEIFQFRSVTRQIGVSILDIVIVQNYTLKQGNGTAVHYYMGKMCGISQFNNLCRLLK